MKTLSTLILLSLILMGCRSELASSDNIQRLKYELNYVRDSQDESAHFTARLTNISADPLEIMVQDKRFHAVLKISPSPDIEYEVYDKTYFDLLTTSIIAEPIIALEPNGFIEWIIPLSSLTEFDRKPITQAVLIGTEISSVMDMAIIPKEGEFDGGSFSQTSNTLKIQK